MRTLTYFIATSLDGRIAAADGSFDFFPFDVDYGQQLAVNWGDAFPTAFHDAFGTIPPGSVFDTVVMGRGTFEPAIQAGQGDPYAHLDTYVYSSSLDPAEYPDVTIVASDPVTHIRGLKGTDGGGIWLCGGGRLAASIVGEIDRLVLKLNPVTIGSGRLLINGLFHPQAWQLDDIQTFDLGVILCEYSRLS